MLAFNMDSSFSWSEYGMNKAMHYGVSIVKSVVCGGVPGTSNGGTMIEGLLWHIKDSVISTTIGKVA